MAEQHITQGFIETVFSDPQRATLAYPVPVLQCLHIKHLENKTGNPGLERYRIVLSDIRNFVQCMLATQANHVMHNNQLQRGSIVRLRQYQAQSVKGKNLMMVLDLEVIESLGTPEKIGDPKPVDGVGAERQNTVIGGAGFYGTKNEPAQETKPAVARQPQGPSRPVGGLGGGGGGRGSSLASTIYPIEAVSPFATKWTIKARVTSKSEIRHWHKQNGEGKLFSFNLLDETSEIRATAFNNEVDKFYDLIQEGSVYYISTPCRVSMAKKQFSNLPNDYELMLESGTVIEKAEDQSSVPQVRYNFCNLRDLNEVEKDATVDVIGVVKNVADVERITSKTTQKEYEKRELTLVDDTGYSVRVAIWGRTATEFDAAPESVLAFKGTRVGEFSGTKTLSLLSSGTMTVDPDIPEAHKIKGWYEADGRNSEFVTHKTGSLGASTGRRDEPKTAAQVKEATLGIDEMQYFTVKATIVFLKQENYAYPACLNPECNKKVIDMGDGWKCEKCNVTHDRPRWRYILLMGVCDHTGHLQLNAFDDSARTILGHTADELKELEERNERVASVFEAASCRKWEFRCRAKMEMYNDQARMRYNVMNVTPINYAAEGHKLAEMIKQLGGW
ncbi:hypothetical protein VTJ83DRAFT_7254 [Remersonia thermophila]|uniref:Replication protein A subunit n=1 Tax=Remersonia thermophila TaxID=72144 RepID=A0ABR4D2Y6_9PEZI